VKASTFSLVETVIGVRDNLQSIQNDRGWRPAGRARLNSCARLHPAIYSTAFRRQTFRQCIVKCFASKKNARKSDSSIIIGVFKIMIGKLPRAFVELDPVEFDIVVNDTDTTTGDLLFRSQRRLY